jgi:glycerol transport system permease protein
MNEKRFQKRTLFLFAYLLFAVLPIYWMINMSFKTNEEILSTFTFFPQHFTWANYKTIFTDESWYSGYINSLIYVSINMVITLTVACLRPMRSRATASWATSMCSSGC